jgi:hypothetical protein
MSRQKLYSHSTTSTLSSGINHSIHDGNDDVQHGQSINGILI